MATTNNVANNLASLGLGESTTLKPVKKNGEVGKDEF